MAHHKYVGLRYEQDQNPLSGMADADWAVKHSTSGYLFTMAKAAISWGSKKQPSIALSSCEAEIMAASEAAKEAVYLDRFNTELGLKPNSDPIRLSLDNARPQRARMISALHLLQDPIERAQIWI